MKPDTNARPSLERPAVWRAADNGWRLAWGGNLIAVIAQVRPAAWNGHHRYLADRIDATAPGLRFRTLAAATEWCESAEWYGPVKPRIARSH